MEIFLIVLLTSCITIGVSSLIYFVMFFFEYKSNKKDYDNYFLEHPELSSEPLNNLYYRVGTVNKEMMETTTIMAAIGIIPALLILLLYLTKCTKKWVILW